MKLGFASVYFLVYSRYEILNFLLLNSQDNSLQAVWPCSQGNRKGDRRLIRFVLVIRG